MTKLKCPLFEGISSDDVIFLVELLEPRFERFPKNQLVLLEGDETGELGIVLEGRLAGERLTEAGLAITVSELTPGAVFGDMLSGSGEKSPVNVRAELSSLAAFLPLERVIAPRGARPAAEARLIRNLIGLISQKYLSLQERVNMLTAGPLKERVRLYFERYRVADQVVAPHDREQMARFLGCERSALSRVLSELARDGEIEFHRNHFSLLKGYKGC